METRTVKLGDLSSDLKGQYGINASAVPLRTTLPTYLRITDIDDFGRIKHDGLCSVETDELNKYSLREGDLVFSRTGNSTGRNYWYDSHDGSFVFAGFLIRFHFEETEELVPRFLKYYVQSTEYYDWIEGFSTGSTRKNLNARDYGNLPVVLPPKAYQQKVVAILDMIENKILLNQQINKNLLHMMETKWRKQFEGLDANQGHFTDLADVVAGGTPSKKQSEYFGGNIAWITPKDMSKTTRVFIEHGTLNITKIGLNNSSAKLIPKGTILFSSRAPIGYIGIAANPVSTNQGFKSLVPKRKEFTEYLYFLLKRLTPLIENIASGSTFKEISGAGMKSVDFPLPTSDMIEAFHHEARSLFDLIKCNEKQSQYLNFIRNLILPKLLSGDINLSGMEEAIKNA